VRQWVVGVRSLETALWPHRPSSDAAPCDSGRENSNDAPRLPKNSNFWIFWIGLVKKSVYSAVRTGPLNSVVCASSDGVYNILLDLRDMSQC
jgi:hypothetical protein